MRGRGGGIRAVRPTGGRPPLMGGAPGMFMNMRGNNPPIGVPMGPKVNMQMAGPPNSNMGPMQMGRGPMSMGPNYAPSSQYQRSSSNASASVSGNRPPFDLVLCENAFPRTQETDESQLIQQPAADCSRSRENERLIPVTPSIMQSVSKTFTQQALIKRNSDLTPTPTEQTAVMNLVSKVTTAVERLIVAPDTFTAATIDEVRVVGSFKKSTMITKRNVADLVVILKTLPTMEAVSAVGNRISEEIKAQDPREVLGCVTREFGCEIAGTQAVVRLLITTIPPNIKKLDSSLHLNTKLVQSHLAAVRHARWFEENASQTNIKVLVRLWKDLRERFLGLRPLNPWMIDLLAHYAVMNTPNRQPLPLYPSFKRMFQLLAAGIFMPGSAGIVDPCDMSQRVHNLLTPQEQDELCSTAQTLLRVLCHGGYKHVLGFEGNANVATEMSIWDGVVVTPLETAYEPNMDHQLLDELSEGAKPKSIDVKIEQK